MATENRDHGDGRRLPVLLALLLLAAPATAQARLGDLVELDGVRDNTLLGLGLVVGLNGTGDTGIPARAMASNMLRRLNLNIAPELVKPANVAVVTVTATLPPFRRPGDRIDATVSSIGDADSLFGGTLLTTQLMAPDLKTTFALASGPVLTGAITASGASGSTETINHPTVGRVPNGAILERDVPQRIMSEEGILRVRLRNPSYVTARNAVEAVNKLFPGAARALDGVTVSIAVPADLQCDPVRFLAQVNDLRIAVDNRAKVVISERNGTIVAGDNVVVLPVAISHGNLAISISEAPEVSQPEPFSERGKTVVVPRSDVKVSERGIEMRKIPTVVSAGELARALNSLGVGPRDLITIFQMLKANGALQAELEVQ
jgi:flagellar P-ring protein precursor FlgI